MAEPSNQAGTSGGIASENNSGSVSGNASGSPASGISETPKGVPSPAKEKPSGGDLPGVGVPTNDPDKKSSDSKVDDSPASGFSNELNQQSKNIGDFTVVGNPDDYTFDGAILTVKGTGKLTISNTNTPAPTTNRVAVAAGVAANVKLAGVDIDVAAINNDCALELKDGASLDLVLDGNNVLKSGTYCAGLQVPANASLGVQGAGNLYATGGLFGAGIGAGGSGIRNPGGTIAISGGTVTATGGLYGAGIGGGMNGAGGTIAVSGGTVVATGGGSAAGIGIGTGGAPGTFSAAGEHGSPGNAFILANSIKATTDDKAWSGVIFQGANGQVYGSPTLALDATVPEGRTLTVPSGSPLSLGGGATLTNDGAIENHGGITGSNPLAGTGAPSPATPK